jgi:16S rRNA (cytidine1402-2'-O)-methyltransferase
LIPCAVYIFDMMNATHNGKVYLIPCFLNEDNVATIPSYVLEAVKQCSVFFVENERSARRYLKQLWREMVIDNYQWHTIGKAEASLISIFKKELQLFKTVGIISEAGCPAIADPGQLLIAAAQQINATILPLVGPSSILLALMGSGMNGQQFQFVGYLPIDKTERLQKLKLLEQESAEKKCTQIFIETPYRNNQLIESICSACRSSTQLCIAADLTGTKQQIQTKPISLWQQQLPDLHKIPAIFLLYAG